MTDTTLSVDQAVAELVGAPIEGKATLVEERTVGGEPQEEQEQPATEEAAADPEPETAEEDASEEAEPEAEEDPEPEEPEAAAIEPPKTWDAEDKEWFAAQPPEVQARLLKNEEKREAVLVKAKEKAAAEARREVDGERQQLGQIGASLKEWLPRAIASHQMFWGKDGFDMVANVEAYGADEAIKLEARYKAEVQELENLVEAQKMAERETLLAYQREQHTRLTEIRPEFADPKTAGPLKKELAEFLVSEGATKQQLEEIPAWGISLALDGMRYRKAQAEAKAKAKAPQKPLAPVLKPTTPPPQSSDQKSLRALSTRLTKEGSVDAAVDLLLAEDQARRRA